MEDKGNICQNISHFFPARRACALRALGLLLADVALTVGRGKTFWRINQVFFYKNGCSSGTESRKWLLRWEMNDLSKGYKQSVDQNWGRVVKIGFFGQKLRFRAQKKHTLLSPNHVPATTGKICPQKKVASSQINISLLRNFGCFFCDKVNFWPKKILFGWT